ncbi:MAG: DNA-3-methyladenine glycosylase 2 family protein [Gemmatimonadetes bacterium]|nr:DNA-3-methyladenine glycosylase 2 family protein [Gemmatimonadota bacterium]
MKLPTGFQPRHSIGFLSRRAVTGLEAVGPFWYARGVRVPNPTWLVVQFENGRMSATADPGGDPGTACRLARRLFDLDLDRSQFLALARRDSVLGRLVRRLPERRRVLLLDPFEAAVRAVVGQLISVAAATTVLTRVIDETGIPIGNHPGRVLFPSPERLADATARLARCGLTAAKARAIVALARHTADRPMLWSNLTANPAGIDEALGGLPGIGPWTRDYIRYRGLADPDAFLSGDLGVVKAMAALGISALRIEATADRWRPWRALAVPLLWASLEPA